MSVPGPGKPVSIRRQGHPDAGFLGLLRSVARIAIVIGAVGSVVLMLREGRDTPRLLLVTFVIWVLSPFVALAWAGIASVRWATLPRITLYGVTLAITLGSFAGYGRLIPPPVGSAHAFMFVVIPAGSWLLLGIAVPIAALVARRLARPDRRA
jgi:hypothetical protein